MWDAVILIGLVWIVYKLWDTELGQALKNQAKSKLDPNFLAVENGARYR
jgi:hypothetical protein